MDTEIRGTELQYESLEDPGVIERHQRLAALLELTAGDRVVVDLGCGDGATLGNLLAHLDHHSHPDYDAMVFTAPDLELTRRLVHAYCDTQQDWMDAVTARSAAGCTTLPPARLSPSTR